MCIFKARLSRLVVFWVAISIPGKLMAQAPQAITDLLHDCAIEVKRGNSDRAIHLLNSVDISEVVKKQMNSGKKLFFVVGGIKETVLGIDPHYGNLLLLREKDCLYTPLGLGEHDRNKADSNWKSSAVKFGSRFNMLMYHELSKSGAVSPPATIDECREALQIPLKRWDALTLEDKLRIQLMGIQMYRLEQRVEKLEDTLQPGIKALEFDEDKTKVPNNQKGTGLID